MTILAATPAAVYADHPRTLHASAGANHPVLQVSSRAFSDATEIPPRYTCDGLETTPPLAWSDVPAGTRSVAILVEGPDAPNGTSTHWLVTGIPPTTTSLAAGAALPPGATAARNSEGLLGYEGPCPAHGRHRYVFSVFALDGAIPPPETRDAFFTEATGHTLAEGQLVGTYARITPP